ncbi:MAG: class I SAM-dependent methyltransferase [Planctomycetota bacterium]|jgi:hypothetical protein
MFGKRTGTKRYLRERFPRCAATLEYLGHPERRDSWEGAFNGQTGRQQIFLDLLEACDFDALVETGAYRGSTTEFIARHASNPIHSVEIQPRYAHFARLRLRRYRHVHLSRGDSRSFLRRLADDPAVPDRNTFFYLDAHWEDDLPLADETEIIAKHWQDAVIMVDDFEVPDDPGYAFDDYGSGRRLCLEYLPPLEPLDLHPFFPALPADDETGSRRGCVVLAQGRAAARVATCASLRRHELVAG